MSPMSTPAVKESPAPVVSMVSTLKAGMWPTKSSWFTQAPLGPSVTMAKVTPSSRSRVAAAAGSASPVMPSASGMLGMNRSV